jgi:hypothetical protein
MAYAAHTVATCCRGELLCYARDYALTADEFATLFGGAGGQLSCVLGKAMESGRVRLSADGLEFVRGTKASRLDCDEVTVGRRDHRTSHKDAELGLVPDAAGK